jgi:hypothetical protein
MRGWDGCAVTPRRRWRRTAGIAKMVRILFDDVVSRVAKLMVMCRFGGAEAIFVLEYDEEVGEAY